MHILAPNCRSGNTNPKTKKDTHIPEERFPRGNVIFELKRVCIKKGKKKENFIKD